MEIGIIGSGHIGGTLGTLWAEAGHQVALSNSRGPASLAPLVAEIGPQARATSINEATAFGDAVLVALPFGRYEILPAAQLSGKLVIDAMNYYPQRDGQIDLGSLTSTELVAQHLPDSRLVKAFNTMYYQTLATEGRPSAPPDDRLVMFLAGDDPEAKSVTARLIEEIGFTPFDTGSPIHNRPMTLKQAQEILATAE
jgi:8-hydroxy-5-deazaflavin:NADPH oxidoreductase